MNWWKTLKLQLALCFNALVVVTTRQSLQSLDMKKNCLLTDLASVQDTFKWIQFNESCNSQDLTVYNHSDRKNSSSNITIYGSINKIKKLTTQATINGQMEKGVLIFTVWNNINIPTVVKMCYAFENEPFYELTTATRRNAYPYVAKLTSINGSVPHDSLQASENVAIASMLNTKYLIIAGIGLTNYELY